MAADLCAAVLVIGVIAYAVLGGADFGAGFWDLTAGGAERGARVRGLVKRSMGPVWEANHVWLIFVLVIFWTAFPEAFGAVMSTLYVPLFLAAIGIIFRGAAFAIRGEAATIAEARFLGAMFALSSVLVPFFLGATVGAIASGQVPAPPGNSGEPISSWTNATSIYAGVLAIGVGAYLSAVFLAADAVRTDLPDLVEAFRRRAVGSAVVVGALAIGGIAEVKADAPELYDGLTSGVALVAVIGSIVAGAVTAALLWQRRFAIARFTSAAAVGAVIGGLALAIRPDLLPGVLTLDQASAGNDTLIPLLGGFVLAAIVLVPSLTWLYRLTLRGTLDTEFHPIGAADSPPTEPPR
jgi:cytochrome d ubiquinol oxidase subunit II